MTRSITQPITRSSRTQKNVMRTERPSVGLSVT